MTSRVFIIAVLIILLAAFFLFARWITKLPSKYERQPHALSDWSALDVGIDPSDSLSRNDEIRESN